jgi:hypothetical protein
MVYDDGSLGVKRTDRFARPEGWTSYDCPKEIIPDAATVGAVADDEFFD